MTPLLASTTEQASTLVTMPGRGSPKVVFRLPMDLWTKFEETAREAGVDRSEVLREFVRWWTRQPGAKNPTRP